MERGRDEAETVWDLLGLLEAVDDIHEALRLGCSGLCRLVSCRVIAVAWPDELAEAQWSLTVYRGDEKWSSPRTARILAPVLYRVWSRGRSIRLGPETAIMGAVRAPEGKARGEGEQRTGIGGSIANPPRRFRISHLAAVPLLTSTRRYGVLVVGRSQESDFARREIVHMTRLAEHLALKLDRGVEGHQRPGNEEP